MSVVSLFLVDDHHLFRSALKLLLERTPGFQILGDTGHGEDVAMLCHTLQPDVVLLDITMEDIDGTEVLKRLKADHSASKVIMLSSHADQAYIDEAIASGADGYLHKTVSKADLISAILAVMKGECWIQQMATPALPMLKTAAWDQEISQLSPRQREVLTHFARGGKTREIAESLGISIKTVETHRRQIGERLGINDLAGLVRCAIRNGLIEL